MCIFNRRDLFSASSPRWARALAEALMSRKGSLVADARPEQESVHNVTFGLTSAYHRIVAGLVFTAGWFLI